MPDDLTILHLRRALLKPVDLVAAQHASESIIMLVTFSCPAYADITMFGDVAVRLLQLMGHSGTVPGALLADAALPCSSRSTQQEV